MDLRSSFFFRRPPDRFCCRWTTSTRGSGQPDGTRAPPPEDTASMALQRGSCPRLDEGRLPRAALCYLPPCSTVPFVPSGQCQGKLEPAQQPCRRCAPGRLRSRPHLTSNCRPHRKPGGEALIQSSFEAPIIAGQLPRGEPPPKGQPPPAGSCRR